MDILDVYTKPYIIVTLGPTGSGKSKLIDKTIAYLGLNPRYTKILVDDLVENNSYYKEIVLSIILDVEKKCKRERKFCKDVECNICDTSPYYRNPSEELLKSFETSYRNIRFDRKVCDKDKIKDTCENVNDYRLKKAISNRDNIVFETTGLSIPSWLLNEPFINRRYDVYFSYSVVNFDKLIQRNTSRTINSIHMFLKDQSNPGPRLPDIREHIFVSLVRKIRDTLSSIRRLCLRVDRDEKMCGKQPIKKLLIFNNSGKRMKIAFDSSNTDLTYDQFDDLIDRLFAIPVHIYSFFKGRKKSIRNIRKNKKSIRITKKS